jgi:hypothetical protein
MCRGVRRVATLRSSACRAPSCRLAAGSAGGGTGGGGAAPAPSAARSPELKERTAAGRSPPASSSASARTTCAARARRSCRMPSHAGPTAAARRQCCHYPCSRARSARLPCCTGRHSVMAGAPGVWQAGHLGRRRRHGDDGVGDQQRARSPVKEHDLEVRADACGAQPAAMQTVQNTMGPAHGTCWLR